MMDNGWSEDADPARDPMLEAAFRDFVQHAQAPPDFAARVRARIAPRRTTRPPWAWRRAVARWGGRAGVPQGDRGAEVPAASRPGRRGWWAWLTPVAHRPAITALATGLLVSVGLNTWLGYQVLEGRPPGTTAVMSTRVDSTPQPGEEGPQGGASGGRQFTLRGGAPEGTPQHPEDAKLSSLPEEGKVVRALTTLAGQYYHMGQYARSITVASAALTLDHESTQVALALFYRGMAYDEMGNRPQALADVRRAARLGEAQAHEVLRAWGVD